MYTVSQKTSTQTFCANFGKLGPIFTARCNMCIARYCYSKSSVRPSVRPSVCLSVTMYRGRMYWVSLKVIT